MDEARNHHSQQSNTRTENQTLHIVPHKEDLNNESTWTQGGECHTRGPVGGWEARGGTALGEIPNIDNRVVDAANHCGTCIAM